MLDCSVVVDVLTGAPGSEAVHGLLVAEQLSAPTLIDHEVVSALRGLTQGGHLTPVRAGAALDDYEDLPLERVDAGHGLRRRAFQLRDALTAYDAAYVVLAEALECPLVTRDAPLARACARLVDVRLL